MSTVMRSARGASAFTHVDSLPSRAVEEASLILSAQERMPQQTWDQLIDDLLDIRKLEDDWDGQGAEAPNPVLVDGAIKLARYLQQAGVVPATRVIAGLGGTVYLEWQTPRFNCEIEVFSPMEAEYRWLPKGASSAEVIRIHLQT